MSEARRRRRTILLLACGVGLAIVVGVTLLARRSETIPLGARKQWDDFAFAVVDVRRLDAIDGLRPTRGAFLVVRFGIRNKAKRVEYRFQPERLTVEDGRGGSYPLDAEATSRRRTSPEGMRGCEVPIPAGKSCTTDLVFDVPADVVAPRLRMSSGTVGDALDRIVSGKVRFALDD